MKVQYSVAVSPCRKQNIYRAYFEELWQEIELHGYIDKLKNIPQLGNINVPKKLQKSR